jgi:hypothetical protein
MAAMARSLPGGWRQWLRRVSEARAVRIRSGQAMRVDAAASMGKQALRMSALIGDAPRVRAPCVQGRRALRSAMRTRRPLLDPAAGVRGGARSEHKSLLVNQSCIM